jgi:hypothetical protein
MGSHLLTTSVDILSTLNPIQRTRLECIRLTTGCFYKWLCRGARHHLAQAWRNLDTILSELAKATIGVDGKRLTLVFVGTHDAKCIPFGRKWLPEILPRFGEAGELRIEYERSRLRVKPDHSCICNHDPVCLEGECEDPSQR